MNVAFSALVPLLVRHLASYVELGGAAAAEYRGAWSRRLTLLAVGLLAALTGLMALWAAGLVAFWDTEWRVLYAFGSAAVLLVGAIAAVGTAMSSVMSGPTTSALKAEMQKDLELFRQWKGKL